MSSVRILGSRLTVLHIYAHDMHAAVRSGDRFRRRSESAVFGHARAHRKNFANVLNEINPVSSISLQCREGVALESPRSHFAGGIGGIHVKVDVRVVPVDLRESTFDIDALGSIEFGLVGMVCERYGNTRAQKRHQQDRKLTLHGCLLEAISIGPITPYCSALY